MAREKYVEDKTQRFINPYNFVPFEGECKRERHQRPIQGKSGYLDCQLELLTPLFIPNTSNDHAFYDSAPNVKSYDFFSYTDLQGKKPEWIRKHPQEPVIPGSEIRGAVRSVFEAAFNGCMSGVDGKQELTRRSPDVKYPGILRRADNDNWELISCERWMLHTQYPDQEKLGRFMGVIDYNNLKEGQKLYVQRSEEKFVTNKYSKSTPYYIIKDYSFTKPKNFSEKSWAAGYLHKGETFGRKKHSESVFVIHNASFVVKKFNKKNIDDIEDMKNLRKVLADYRNQKKNRYIISKEKTWYKEYLIDEKECILVYYRKVGNHVYMCPACIGKEVFYQSIENILRKNGNYNPCDNRNSVCSTCALFGMVSGNESGKSFASRVRFSDARFIGDWEENAYMHLLILPELGEPKPGTVEFYTEPPDLLGKDGLPYWTYDYKKVGGRYTELSEELPKLRGRKFYWHNSECSTNDGLKKVFQRNKIQEYFGREACNLPEMKQVIRPLKVRNDDDHGNFKFEFRVYFENLTDLELQRLAWSLDFNDEKCAHKIGRGKPLGFGSVKIVIKKLKLRRIDFVENKYDLIDSQLEKVCNENLDLSHIQTLEKLKMITCFDNGLQYVNKNGFASIISYPIVKANSYRENDSAAHQWFTYNRGNLSTDGFLKVLPKPEEEIQKEHKKQWLYGLRKRS